MRNGRHKYKQPRRQSAYVCIRVYARAYARMEYKPGLKLLVLPPHELNHCENLFYHHTELTAGRILTSVHNSNLYQPPLETGLDDS